MNKTEAIMQVVLDDYLRLIKIMACEAYNACVHKNKPILRCSKRGLCYEEGIVDFRFSQMVRLN